MGMEVLTIQQNHTNVMAKPTPRRYAVGDPTIKSQISFWRARVLEFALVKMIVASATQPALLLELFNAVEVFQ